MIRYSLIFLLFLSHSAAAQSSQDLSHYLQQRDSLLRLDSLDFDSWNLSLSQEEKALNHRMKRLQRKNLDAYKAQHFFPPARNFYQSKQHIEQSSLFQLFQRMPKGGILHLHDKAMADALWVVEKAIETPEMHVYWEEEENGYIKGQFYAYAEGQAPQGFYPVHVLAKQDPHFKKQLESLLIFDASIDGDSVDIWKHFEAIFQRIYGLASYRPIYPEYLYRGMEILIQDNVQHIEIRGEYDNQLYDLQHKHGELTHDGLIEEIRQVYTRAKKLDPDFSLSLIWANLRFRDQESIGEDMLKALDRSLKNPDLIRGYDLVAEEDNGNPTLFHVPQFLTLKAEIEKKNADFALYLHDGESNWMNVSNLYDAVLLGSKRIGHAFNLFRFPRLMDLVKERNICLEISPLSNQILGYIRDLRLHPASTYMRTGIDCVISSDDPQIFNYQGLAYDFWSVYMAWELDLADLKKLCKNSIVHAALPSDQKAKALETWEKRWNAFVQNSLQTWEVSR